MDERRADAKPSKAFFIEMLTKDIGLVECVLDLADNAIDSLIRQHNLDVMELLLGKAAEPLRGSPRIDITVSPNAFEITDNCGGIPLKAAAEQVFRFGGLEHQQDYPGLSVYGIGMKRACFKLGTHTEVHSHTGDTEFEVVIDTEDWKKNLDDWTFPFAYEGKRRSETKGPPGTTIRVAGIHRAVRPRLSSSAFLNELAARLSSTYALFIQNAVRLTVNGKQVTAQLPQIGQSAALKPVRKKFDVDGTEVVIYAGLSPESVPAAKAGWYIFCNGRLVLEADRTTATGWGDGLPQFHFKHNRFVGYAYFRNDNPAALPWMTTKRGVDTDSPVFQKALAEMNVQARPVLNFLSKLYPSDPQTEDVPERDVLGAVKGVSVDKLEHRNTPFVVEVPKKPRSNQVNILYKRPRAAVERIKQHLNKPAMSSRAVGQYTFDYFLKKVCP